MAEQEGTVKPAPKAPAFDHAKAVRDAAQALKTAITAAKAAGCIVSTTIREDHLDRIAVSDTRKVK